jgi:hypothetical protein
MGAHAQSQADFTNTHERGDGNVQSHVVACNRSYSIIPSHAPPTGGTGWFTRWCHLAGACSCSQAANNCVCPSFAHAVGGGRSQRLEEHTSLAVIRAAPHPSIHTHLHYECATHRQGLMHVPMVNLKVGNAVLGLGRGGSGIRAELSSQLGFQQGSGLLGPAGHTVWQRSNLCHCSNQSLGAPRDYGQHLSHAGAAAAGLTCVCTARGRSTAELCCMTPGCMPWCIDTHTHCACNETPRAPPPQHAWFKPRLVGHSDSCQSRRCCKIAEAHAAARLKQALHKSQQQQLHHQHQVVPPRALCNLGRLFCSRKCQGQRTVSTRCSSQQQQDSMQRVRRPTQALHQVRTSILDHMWLLFWSS